MKASTPPVQDVIGKGHAAVDELSATLGEQIVSALRDAFGPGGYCVVDMGPVLTCNNEVVYGIELNAPDGTEYVIDIYRFIRHSSSMAQ